MLLDSSVYFSIFRCNVLVGAFVLTHRWPGAFWRAFYDGLSSLFLRWPFRIGVCGAGPAWLGCSSGMPDPAVVGSILVHAEARI